ncbi:hypothetical protein HMSSN139_67590 [Paenibacillus sp. HMSSN-139]|nr:hypothetical protein HMSSN139_67590 [Paenibacillus sp. HMSSN-139]
MVKALVDGVEFDNTKIVDFIIENSMTSMDGFELGTAIPSKLVITIRTGEKIPQNAKIMPYVSLSMSGLTWEEATYPWEDMQVTWQGVTADWIPLGEFYVDTREKVSGVWTFTCYDKLVFADEAYVSFLTYPTSMQNVWNEICTSLGYAYDSSVVINPAYQIQAGPAGYTKRQVLGYIAGANSANVFVGKDGVIKFKRFTAAAPPDFNMGPSEYVRVKQTNPIKTYNRVVVTYNTEDQLTYEAGSGDENHTLNLENPFMTQTMVNNLQSALNGFSYIPVSMDARGFPQLDQGDIIEFEQYEGVSWLEAITSWQDTVIPWNGMVKYQTVNLRQTFGFAGGLKMSIESPSISDQQSEFKVDGSLTTAVNKLNKTAVKEGKSYYGATITRTEGLIIEREDHASKAVFNSDELSFYADGDRALWFDLPSRKFIFGGDLEAAGGTFSGTLQAVDGVFTGTLSGVDGTFTGTVSAGRIEGGDIIGSFIQGADILGSSIRTATFGNRIELDPDGFRFYDDFGGLRVTLGYNPSAGISGHTYYNSSSSSQGLIYAVSNALHVIGVNGMLLNTLSGKIEVQGVIDFSGATVIGL